MVPSARPDVLLWRHHRRALATLVGTFLLLSTGACDIDDPVEFQVIEQPSAVVHYVDEPSQAGNLISRHVGAVRTDGGIDGLPPSGAAQSDDLTGAYFAFEFDHQFAMFVALPVPHQSFAEVFGHRSVLEFTFPEATLPGLTTLSWFVTPHLRCSYNIEPADYLTPSYETGGADPYVSFEYAILEDPLELYSLDPSHPVRISEILWSDDVVENEQEHTLEGEVAGVLLASNDDRQGVMQVPEGNEAKLYVAVSVQLRSFVAGDWIQIGVREPGAAPDFCTFEFGSESYYTMRPIASGAG